jgi:hypothetical protein
VVHKQLVELRPGRRVDVTFRPANPGVFTASVVDAQGDTLATRSLDIKVIDREFVYTARDMETLGGWAAISDGIAVRSEACDDAQELFEEIKNRTDQSQRGSTMRHPAGINGWMLAVLLGFLAAEWLLRKRWGMI